MTLEPPEDGLMNLLSNTVTGWSYGKTANQTGTGYRVGEIENTNVSWEEATKVNAGIELRLFEKIKDSS